MVSNRKAKIIIPKDLYDSDVANNFLFKLEMKIYRIEYISFTDVYEIYFTSKYVDEISEGQEPPTVLAYYTPYGFSFKGCNNDWFIGYKRPIYELS